MDKEFHSQATGLIAKRAGFTEREAEIAAHSTQFVDEKDVALTGLDIPYLAGQQAGSAGSRQQQPVPVGLKTRTFRS